jgi:hypothetical protein
LIDEVRIIAKGKQPQGERVIYDATQMVDENTENVFYRERARIADNTGSIPEPPGFFSGDSYHGGDLDFY